MNLVSIRPFVRFARYTTLTPECVYPSRIPLDARLFFVCGGHGEIAVGSDVFDMKKHSCLILPQGTEYALISPKKSVTYIMLNFDYDYREGSPRLPVPPVIPSEFTPSMLISPNGTDGGVFELPLYISDANIEDELIKIELECSREYEHHDVVAGNILHNILIRCSCRRNLVGSAGVRLDAERILDYIHENFAKDLTNDDIAAVFGFNPNYISSVIKKLTNLPLHKYLLHIRLVKSLSYLEMQKYSISETASLCGFKDMCYFSRYFKKEIGVSPSKYVAGKTDTEQTSSQP